MATFRSVFFSAIFLGAIFSASFLCLGAAFAPLSPVFPLVSNSGNQALGADSKTMLGLSQAEFFCPHNKTLTLAAELILTRRMTGISA